MTRPFLIPILIALFLPPGFAAGQEGSGCDIDFKTAADDKEPPAVGDLLTCLAEMKKVVDALQNEILPNAILAFNRSGEGNGDQPGGACPPGWEVFKDAQGRMIVGAGRNNNTDENGAELIDRPAFAEDPKEAVGGAEKHVLKPAEVQNHQHIVRWATNNFISLNRNATDEIPQRNEYLLDWPEGNQAGRADDRIVAISAGENQPHNNMPPYIALYFCQKKAG